MLCRIYTEAGQLLAEGACGLRRDGGLELVPLHAQRPLRAGEGPLLVVEGPRRYPARVSAVHDPRDATRPGATTIYHLTPLVGG
jgi:hypothetical protein